MKRLSETKNLIPTEPFSGDLESAQGLGDLMIQFKSFTLLFGIISHPTNNLVKCMCTHAPFFKERKGSTKRLLEVFLVAYKPHRL